MVVVIIWKHLCVGREKDSEGAIALVNLETPLRRQRKAAKDQADEANAGNTSA